MKLILNLFPIVKFPDYLHVARVEFPENDWSRKKDALRGTGIFHHFKYGNMYFFGDPATAERTCNNKGWTYHLAESHPLSGAGIPYDPDILLVLLYRSFHSFLWDRDFQVRYRDAFIKKQPIQVTQPLVYERFGHQVHEGFSNCFRPISSIIYLGIVPKIVVCKIEEGKPRPLSTEDYLGVYTKINSKRYCGTERKMLKFWLDFLSNRTGFIQVPIRGSATNLSIATGLQSVLPKGG